jgi:hypothetical protein
MRKASLMKMGLTIILFIVLFIKIDISEVLVILSSLHIGYYVLALIFIPLLYVIRTFRWEILLRAMKIKRPFSNLLLVLIIGVFYGLITPGKVGELGRAYHLKEKKTKTVPTILIEKITDIITLFVLSILTISLFFNNYSGFEYVIFAGALAIILVTWSLTSKNLISLFIKPFKLANEQVDEFVDSFLHIFKNRQIMYKTFFLAICYYVINYISAYFLLLALDIDPSTVIALPLVVLMGNIPVTISGLGLRESMGAICFILLGESGANGVSFSMMLFVTTTLLPGFFGYLFLLAERKSDMSSGN